MMRIYVLALVALLSRFAMAEADQSQHFVDIDAYANCQLSKGPGSGYVPIDLAASSVEGQRFDDVRFKIGPGLMHLGSSEFSNYPAKIESVPVNRAFKTLCFLHGTCNGGGPNEESSPGFVADGKVIGHYMLHYVDGVSKLVPIVYGEDVRDWWFRDDEKRPSNAAVVWTGDHQVAKELGCRLRLYVSKWTNPRPSIEVKTIDYVGRASESPAAPFCIAITTLSP